MGASDTDAKAFLAGLPAVGPAPVAIPFRAWVAEGRSEQGSPRWVEADVADQELSAVLNPDGSVSITCNLLRDARESREAAMARIFELQAHPFFAGGRFAIGELRRGDSTMAEAQGELGSLAPGGTA